MAQSGVLVLKQYKVIRVLYTQKEYAAVQAVDILDRQRPIRLLNIYEGAEARRFAIVFDGVRHCPELIEVRMDSSSLVAVFQWRDAPTIDQVFYMRSDQDPDTRLLFCELLFRLALCTWDQPVEFGLAAMQSANLCIMGEEKTLWVNYIMIPCEERLPQREVICLASDQAHKILLESWQTQRLQRRFLLSLERGYWKDAIALNSAWDEFRRQLTEILKEQEGKGFFRKTLGQLWENIQWTIEKRRESK